MKGDATYASDMHSALGLIMNFYFEPRSNCPGLKLLEIHLKTLVGFNYNN